MPTEPSHQAAPIGLGARVSAQSMEGADSETSALRTWVAEAVATLLNPSEVRPDPLLGNPHRALILHALGEPTGSRPQRTQFLIPLMPMEEARTRGFLGNDQQQLAFGKLFWNKVQVDFRAAGRASDTPLIDYELLELVPSDGRLWVRAQPTMEAHNTAVDKRIEEIRAKLPQDEPWTK